MAGMGQHFDTSAFAGRVPTAHAADPAGRVRRDVVRRLRQQVAAGNYDPPVEELVDRLVHLVLYRQTTRRADVGD
ncbi:MAG: flagellar biosynthesis anti-sigma factor FlgM [Acidimicrobiia bacterium]